MDVLKGVRVLDLGRVVSGPYAGWLLAKMGAEVIRIDSPRGEFDRSILMVTAKGESTVFLAAAAGKKSITLDLRGQKGKARELFLKLAEKSDVVLENLGPGIAAALGITFDELRKVRQDIIVAHLTAFGSRGPYRNRTGFDGVAQAMSGIASLTGTETPTRTGITFVDSGTGAHAALAIVAALFDRQRTGRGQEIEASLLATAVAWTSYQIAEHVVAGRERIPRRLGNRAHWAAFSDVCETRDGRLVMLSVVGPLLARVFRAMGRKDLAEDPRFGTDLKAFENRHISDPLIRDWIASKTFDEMEEIAEQLRLPIGPVLDYTEVAHHPQVVAEELFVETISSDRTSTVITPACPVRFSGHPHADQVSIPKLGEHNDEVWGQLCGLSSAELGQMKREGII
ncbi:MAG: CoA transferase [Chloroflexi bacterium]|nr:CoA transferase [Chloroflexota bacterium]